MVKELSPLVLYLRYLAQPGEWLIIDEPEMNLHPKAQVQLTEFLAMLVQAGLHVLITTHSPYMVDHLANLMKAAEHEDKERIREKFYLQRTEAFIPREQVSVYLFGDGTAKNILDEEGEINWGTFSDISDQITQLYFEL
jgi:predicted ATPase